MMSRMLSVMLAAVLVGLFLCPSAYSSSSWTVKDAYKQRISKMKATAAKCEKGLKQYFPEKPIGLEIILYPSREAFVEGLQEEFGFPQKFALVFKDHGAPRPKNGKMLVPPDQKMENVCHEIVHHYMENCASREKLLGAKWFDEGVATLLAARIIGGKKAGQSSGLDQIIPLEKMTTEEQWGKLWSDAEMRDIAYTQAALMVGFFFERYSVDQFHHLLQRVKSESFEEAFQKVTGITPEEFYKMWVGQK